MLQGLWTVGMRVWMIGKGFWTSSRVVCPMRKEESAVPEEEYQEIVLEVMKAVDFDVKTVLEVLQSFPTAVGLVAEGCPQSG